MSGNLIPIDELPVELSYEDAVEAVYGDDLDWIENKLRQLGIGSYEAIMNLGPDDFERASDLIPNLESRVKRDNWQQQAEELHQAKYTD